MNKSLLNSFVSMSNAANALGSAFGNSGGVDRIAAGLAQMREVAGPNGVWNTDDDFIPGGGYRRRETKNKHALAVDDPTNVVCLLTLPDPKTWTKSKFVTLDAQPDQTWCLNEDDKSWAPLLKMTELDSQMVAEVPALETPLPFYDKLPPPGIEVRAPAIVVDGRVYRWERGWHVMNRRGLDALLTPEAKYPRKVVPTDPNWGSW